MNEDMLPVREDPLSTALTKMKLRAFLHVALDAGKNWAIAFPAYDGFTLNVVRKGECWLTMKDEEAIWLRIGDCFLLTGKKEFTLARNQTLKKHARAERLFRHTENGFAIYQGGGDCLVNGTIFRFEGHLPALLFRRLPPVIVINGSSDHAAALRWNLERFAVEMRGGSGVGRSFMLGHLAPVMLLQALRMYLSTAKDEDNWLVALANPRLSKTLEAMQLDYRRSWSIEQLADLAHMSRSGFALVFKRSVGLTPMDYLKHWRMQIARELLQGSEDSLAAIANATGYGSESAFSAAFQNTFNCRPGAYRRSFSAAQLEESLQHRSER